ncbi:MAG: lipocalin family protein [Pseudomonadota bacterium]
MHRIALFLSAFVLVGCAGGVYRDQATPISSIAAFEPARYAGLWYEVARYEVPFQRGCTDVTAEYQVVSPTVLSVENTCVRGDERDSIAGTATLAGPGRLAVRFQGVPFVSAPYWVLWVDADYRTAVVGVPSGRAGWILNRDPQIPRDRLNAALQILEFNGYDTGQITMTPQSAR